VNEACGCATAHPYTVNFCYADIDSSGIFGSICTAFALRRDILSIDCTECRAALLEISDAEFEVK
jgi:hypothetical protein